MIGNNYNKQEGQVLLIVIMLLATALTVVLSISFKSSTDTQITKLEQESQMALAAADAGIEKALNLIKDGVIDPGLWTRSFSESPIDIVDWEGIDSDKSKVLVDDEERTELTSPLILQDESHVLYLSDYSKDDGFTNPWSGDLTIYFESESGHPSLELTFIDNNNELSKSVYNSCNLVDPAKSVQNAPGASDATKTIENIIFKCSIDLGLISNNKLLIVRSLFASTKIGFEGSVDLRTQRKMIISTAVSTAGISKQIRMFQYKSQIPSGFFVTSF